MRKLKGQEIRNVWIKFFEGKGHLYVPGVPLVPKDDKSLLWVNAGVTGLKKYFDGSEIPPCRRIVNVQKSIRTNDIENVGHTARHHTFFEMLGNFSIGDYFRKEVIAWAMEILTSDTVGFGLDRNKLYVTYNPHDLEAKECWIKNGLPADHLVPLESNFWEIGEGPCGPNTEVFYDRGEKYDPDHLGIKLLEDEIENDRYIEIWGIVFSQYNAEAGVKRENYKELPSKNIDTGAGLERIACILENTETNFETDLFMPIIKEIEKLSGKKYEGENLLPFRVIADHIRCLVFALNDGATFSNEGRGYVLRRIIRRAMRYGQKIGFHEPFMYKLVPVVVKEYGSFYPELKKSESKTKEVMKDEEKRFLLTLDSGEKILKEYLKKGKVLSGEDAFKLYDTYGFPFDLTKEIAKENHVDVDEDGFNALMESQKERARNARGEIESFHKQSKDYLAFTEPSTFSYDSTCLKSTVNGLFEDGVKVDEIKDHGEVSVLVTPFYREMGGQVSDTGLIYNDHFKGEIVSLHAFPHGQTMHVVKVLEGSLKMGDEVTLKVDNDVRKLTERNHSATHLLHAALKDVLKTPIEQKGSLVNSEYLRFDFGFNRKLTDDELYKVEKLVNEEIIKDIEEKTEVLPLEEAKKTGAEMEFTEKYGDTVRVVSFGDFSKEFCGGTHVKRTSEIGLFVIKEENGIAAGVRRITAFTSLGAYHYLKEKEQVLKDVELLLTSTDQTVVNTIKKQEAQNKENEKKIKDLQNKLAEIEAKKALESVPSFNGTSFLYVYKENADRNTLLRFLDSVKGQYQNYIAIVIGGSGDIHPFLVQTNGSTLDSKKVFDLFKDESVARGGGNPTLVSGSLKVLPDKAKLESKLKELLSK